MPHPRNLSSASRLDRDALIRHLENGCRPEDQWKIGTEHEKYLFRLGDLTPLSYEEEGGIRDILMALQHFGWSPLEENGTVIGMLRADGAAITLEPGGQLELSGAQVDTLHQTCSEIATHRQQVQSVCTQYNAGFLGLGFHPTASREAIHWMPKERYRIMQAYMPQKGSLGLDMMLRTCTVQVNLDYRSESDMVAKMRIGAALQPLATALWANSPFTEGKPNGFLSYRAHVWSQTDPDRCGLPKALFGDGFGFEKWVDYMLDVPMYFVYRQGRYIDASGQSFRDFMDGKLPACPGEYPTEQDWADHLSTAFPDIRLKQYIEMRGADGGPWENLCALPAFWTGLLYDRDSLTAAMDIVKTWTHNDCLMLLKNASRCGLATHVQGRSLQDIAQDVIDIATAGLRRRAHLNAQGHDETHFLDPIRDIIDSGQTAAERLLERYNTAPEQGLSWVFAQDSLGDNRLPR